MKTNVKALVVGGGAVGTSIAYHLAKAGWEDVMLLERDELTSGSTWHAAGLLPYFNMSYATTHIHDYSIKFYKTLEEETGLNAGFAVVGNLRMAQTDERMDEYMLYASTAETCGVPYTFMTPDEIKAKWPLIRTEDLKGALYHETDGYINPADVTMAMAKGARQRGVMIERKWQADAFHWNGETWEVTCTKMVEKGGNLVPSEEQVVITAEHVVTASGNHAQRTAKMLGIKMPAIPVEHQFIVMDQDPELVKWRKDEGHPEHPVIRDADAQSYVREERGGWILGVYEKDAPARFEYGVPDSFRADLFQLDLERIEEQYAAMLHRIPSAEDCGLKDDFNGPICYTPDGNPLVGPAPGLRNMWLAEGFSFGITAAGGTGYYLAQLMVEGEAEIDMASLDPKRYGNWMTTEYAMRKNEEAYEHVYILHHPDEERPAARPLRTSPAYDRQAARGAQFGQVNGWERPNYYAPEGFSDHDSRSFRRGGWWQHAVEEAKAIREGVGLIDATAFTKHLVRGPGATQFLDWFTCNKLPSVGRINLTYALTGHGTTRTEYTIVRLAQDEYYLVSAGAWTAYDADYLKKAIEDKAPEFGYIECHDVTTQWGVFAIAGPKSRDVLNEIVRDADPATVLSNKRFPWLTMRNIELGMCPVRAIRVAYTGELGWELHHPIEMQNYLFDQLEKAGEKHGMKLVGARAQNWLRQEKSYRAFGTELGRDATPLEADLPRFVDLSKDFHGKAKLEETGIRAKCVTLLIDGPADADPWGREVLYVGDERTGRLTSGGYSVAFGKSIGMGYVKPEHAEVGTKLKVKMFDQLWDAEIVQDSPYDPKNERIRARRMNRTLLLLIGAALCVALSLFVARSDGDPLTGGAQAYAADIATKSAATYVTLRTLNAVLSTAQEIEVGLTFIASGTAQPLKVLEPVDDTVERIAALVFGVMVATGVLAVALGPVSALGLALLALALAIAAFFPQRRMSRPLGWYGLFFGLALPVSLVLAAPLSEALTQTTYARNLAVVNEITQQVSGGQEVVAQDLGLNDYRKIAANVWNRADELIGAMVALVGVYVFRIFILPLMLVGGLFFAARSFARGEGGA